MLSRKIVKIVPLLKTKPPLRYFTKISENSYNELAEISLNCLIDSIEQIDLSKSGIYIDASLSQGVLKIDCGSKVWVINKQTPNKQLWWSSPISGPLRFEYSSSNETLKEPHTSNERIKLLKSWKCTRDESNLFDRLREEFLSNFNIDIQRES